MCAGLWAGVFVGEDAYSNNRSVEEEVEGPDGGVPGLETAPARRIQAGPLSHEQSIPLELPIVCEGREETWLSVQRWRGVVQMADALHKLSRGHTRLADAV